MLFIEGGDRAGSIRIPASWCGIGGFKPTHGLVPYTGSVPVVPCLDHLGPMAKSVADCALLLEVIAGELWTIAQDFPKKNIKHYSVLHLVLQIE